MWKWLQGLMGKSSAPLREPAPEPAPAPTPSLLDELLKQVLPRESSQRYYGERIVLKDHPAGRAILDLEGASLADLVVEAARRQVDVILGPDRTNHAHNLMRALPLLAGQFLRRKPILTEEHLAALARTACRAKFRFGELPMPGLLRAFEDHVRANGLSPALRSALEPLSKLMEQQHLAPAELRRIAERLRHLLEQGAPRDSGPELTRGDAWADALLDALDNLSSEEEAAWRDLLAHCATATSSKPSSKWLARALTLVSGLDLPPVLAACLNRIGEPGIRRVQTVMGHPYEPDRTLLDDRQADLLRGLVWCAGLVDDPTLTAAVGKAAEASLRKVENHGPRNLKVGNACLDTLSRLGTSEAVAQLSRLRSRVQHPSSRKQIEAVLDKAAERQGLTKAELEEMSVPTLGLTETGLRRETLGGFTAELRVTGTASTELTWFTPGGKPQKSVPKAVKEGHADELKALTAAAREIQKLLPGQRDRVERLYLFPRDWDLPTWRERYLDHPLVGTLARRLIWRFGDRTGFWREGRIVDAEGRPLDLSDDVRVALWHPLDSAADEVLAWRLRLEAWEVVQPFK